jgi:hypothetical protein
MSVMGLCFWVLIVGFLAGAGARELPSLICEGQCSEPVEVPLKLAPPAYQPIPLGSILLSGWLLGQLVRQANSLSGYMAQAPTQ